MKKKLNILEFLILCFFFLSTIGCEQNGLVPAFLVPDPCTLMESSPSALTQIILTVPNTAIGPRIIVDSELHASLSSANPSNPFVVLIINGNGYGWSSYENLASFLAMNGFIVVYYPRLNYSLSDDRAFDVLTAAFEELGIDKSTPVALLGHSKGGQVAVESTLNNTKQHLGFNIQAVVGLAPGFEEDFFQKERLTGNNTPSYLLIYGSQDEDVEGDNEVPVEAFAAYDFSGTEGSTTCKEALQDCFFIASNASPSFEKIMIFVHGTGHAGFLNTFTNCIQSPTTGSCVDIDNSSNFISIENQFCIGRGYINAFLRWKLRGQDMYKDIVRGKIFPLSIANITTNQPDYKGNPAGMPLRISFQVSTPTRYVIENFEDASFDLFYKDNSIGFGIPIIEDHFSSPNYVRHLTHYGFVGWRNSDKTSSMGFNIPNGSINVSNFSHISLRIGQFERPVYLFENPPNKDQAISICLYDGTKSDCVKINNIPPNDFQPDYITASVMNTFSFSLNEFENVDKHAIKAIGFIFDKNTKGALMLDNIELIRNL